MSKYLDVEHLFVIGNFDKAIVNSQQLLLTPAVSKHTLRVYMVAEIKALSGLLLT